MYFPRVLPSLLLTVVLEASAAVVHTTPPPCNGTDARACPYYWLPVGRRFYEVLVNDVPSFVYQSELPPACANTASVSTARGTGT